MLCEQGLAINDGYIFRKSKFGIRKTKRGLKSKKPFTERHKQHLFNKDFLKNFNE